MGYVSILFAMQNNDITDLDGVEEHLRKTNPAYKRRPQLQFRKVVERAVHTVQREGGAPKPELQLQVLQLVSFLTSGPVK